MRSSVAALACPLMAMLDGGILQISTNET
jgi:hypothetical protein